MKRLIAERDIRLAVRRGLTVIDIRDATVTPSARDAAAAAGISLVLQPAPASPAPAPALAPTPAGTAGTAPRPRIAIGADHGGFAMKNALLESLRAAGYEVANMGTDSSDPVDYPDIASAVARAVASGAADRGIIVDGAGIGSCMAANKIPGVRAAMCYDVTTAQNAREHNNANVLTLGGALIGQRLAQAIADVFLTTPFGGGRHAPRVAKIDALDQ